MLAEETGVPSLRDEEGALREEFVTRVAQAIEAGRVDELRELTADLHEADLGALVEALDSELRPRLRQWVRWLPLPRR